MITRTGRRRGIRVALALMLTTSAAGIVAYQPVVAQTESDYVRAFGNSAYTYCDAKLVGALWGMDPYDGKIQIGMKILGGYAENLVDVLHNFTCFDHGNCQELTIRIEWPYIGFACIVYSEMGT